MASTAVVPTITVDIAMPTMKRCQLDNCLVPAPAPVMAYHHGRREPLMAATIELCSRQATEETVSPLRLRTGDTRMKDISVVLFPPFSVARNRVMVPLLMSCSFQPTVAAVAPAVISRGPRHSTAVVTTATIPIGGPQQQYGSGSCSYRAKPFVRHYRGSDGTALWRNSSVAPAPFVALAGSREALAAMDRP